MTNRLNTSWDFFGEMARRGDGTGGGEILKMVQLHHPLLVGEGRVEAERYINPSGWGNRFPSVEFAASAEMRSGFIIGLPICWTGTLAVPTVET